MADVNVDHRKEFNRRPNSLKFGPKQAFGRDLVLAALRGEQGEPQEPVAVSLKFTPEQWRDAGCPDQVVAYVDFCRPLEEKDDA